MQASNPAAGTFGFHAALLLVSCGSRILNRTKLIWQENLHNIHGMNLLLQLLAQFLRCFALLCRKDGFKAVIAQNLVLPPPIVAIPIVNHSFPIV
jgi:hypothetical protein